MTLRTRASVGALLVGVIIFASVPVFAAEKIVVVFFSGLCRNVVECAAAENAQKSIAPKLPTDAILIAPPLLQGWFKSTADARNLAQQIGSDVTVLVAYSGGYNALKELVDQMTTEQLKKIKTIVSLEAHNPNYIGFHQAVARVRSANPNVEVKLYGASQFGTNHTNMPSSDKMGQTIADLTKGGAGAVPPPPTSAAPPPAVAPPPASPPPVPKPQVPPPGPQPTPPYYLPANYWQTPQYPLSPLSTGGEGILGAIQKFFLNPSSLPTTQDKSGLGTAPMNYGNTFSQPVQNVPLAPPTATPPYQYGTTTNVSMASIKPLNGSTFSTNPQGTGLKPQPKVLSLGERLRQLFRSLGLSMKWLTP